MSAGSVLVVCGKPEYAKELASVMVREGSDNVDCVYSANEARRKLALFEPDLVIVNTPLPDEQGTDFVLDIAEKTEAGILVLARHELLNEMRFSLEKVGALILPKPISRMTLAQTSRFAADTRKSILRLKSQRDDLKRRAQERTAIEKAKWLLVEKLQMTEPQAHRYIQKKAMDMRIAQVKIAEEIILHYE